MHGPKQIHRDDGTRSGFRPHWTSAERWADDWFQYTGRLFEASDLMATEAIANIHQGAVARVDLTISQEFPNSRKRARFYATGDIMSRANWHEGQQRGNDMARALQQRLNHLLQFSCIEYGKVTLVALDGKVLRVVLAPCIERKAEELSILAKLFVAR